MLVAFLYESGFLILLCSTERGSTESSRLFKVIICSQDCIYLHICMYVSLYMDHVSAIIHLITIRKLRSYSTFNDAVHSLPPFPTLTLLKGLTCSSFLFS